MNLSSDSSSVESPIVSSNESSHRDSKDISCRQTSKQSGFRELRSCVKYFSGNKGEDNFQLWVEDHKEA